MLKRIFDIVVAATALILLLPLLIVVAVAVKVDSPGPAVFRQRRIGLHGRSFEILKFRSMIHRPAADGPEITIAGDARVTRLGRILRACKADELPQLWNVIRGDMSLVGPRPEVPRFVAYYSEQDRALVLSVRPGITDYAAIEFRDEAALLAGAEDPQTMYVNEILPRKLEIYRDYAESNSICGDVRILWITARQLLRPSGRREPVADRKTAIMRSTPTEKHSSRR